jgi:cyclopropane fatty-acyl-phospholipid synthase-like methyltransferase
MNASQKSSAGFFEAKYQRAADPWNFERSTYERSRYRSILQALGGTRWRSALEPGCSVGVLTEGLAPFCDRLLALDFSATAVNAAQARCRRFPHIEVRCLDLDKIDSFADFDLIVLSEIGYYFTEQEWANLIERISAEMQPKSTLLAAHWTGYSEDHQMSGNRVHEIIRDNKRLSLQRGKSHAGFRLDRLELS